MKLKYQTFFLVLLCVVVFADTLNGRVVSITDGDTITVLDSSNRQHKIRLQGIDAPEKGQAFGEVSSKHLGDLVHGKQITVDYAKRDRYGRIVGKVMHDGEDACLEQLRAGLAWFYREYERELSEADRKAYSEAEAQARASRRGLWQDSHPIPPWEFRNGSAAETVSASPEQKKSDKKEVTVYVTRTGEKYHRSGCRYLRRSKIPMKKSEAIAEGYTACKVCKP